MEEVVCSDEEFLKSDIMKIHLSIFNPLVDMLDLQNTWNLLVSELPLSLSSKISAARLERDGQRISCSPTKLLFQELSSFGATVADLIVWLEKLNHQRALLLLKPDEPLQILEQPQHELEIEASEDSVLKLRCMAVGFPLPSYQWMKNGVDIISQQEPLLIINSVTLNESGVYVCRVSKHNRETDEEDFIYSETAYVHIKPGRQIHPLVKNFSIYSNQPEIILQPVCPCNGKISQGSSFSLRCEGRSRTELKYHWYCDGELLPGETSNEIKLRNLHPNGGKSKWRYQCRVFNEHGSALSDPVDIELDIAQKDTQYFAEDKVALLIANEKYTNLEPLHLPASDAKTMAQLLTELNYRVFSFVDLSLVEMKNAVELLCQHLRKGVYGVFFYAGHGFQQYGQGYLLPVDASKEYRPSECLCAEYVLQLMQEKNPELSCFLLDACRSLPPRNTWNNNIHAPGVIYHPKMNRNVIIGYSTSVEGSAHEVIGQENGPYVRLLQKHMKEKRTIRDILMTVEAEMEYEPVISHRQFPWTAGNLARGLRFYDPVMGKDPEYKQLVEDWKSLAVIPSARDVHCKDLRLRLEFDQHLRTFWNALDMYIVVEEQPADSEFHVFFYNKEKLKGELRGLLLCIDKKTRKHHCKPIPLELGFPLVSKKFLWQNSLNVPTDLGNDLPINNVCVSVNDLIDLS